MTLDMLTVNVNPRIRERMTIDQVKEFLRKECAKAGGQAAWAKAHGISPSYVSDAMQSRREPGDKILDALGLVRVVTYRKAKFEKKGA